MPPGKTKLVRLQVNGCDYALHLEARVSLLDALRDGLGFTGTKEGRNQGACGACTTDIANPHTPLGAHGVGEIGITGVAVAIANAIFHATGKRVRRLPHHLGQTPLRAKG